ncbi:MAG: Nif3-like dinuclear metal center hexameric protein [Clostridia bacterium]|nr:Nif3-like dinuclear metal center hexameric protein [Clostridia bacterium]
MECRPTVKNIYDYIDSIAPFEEQCEWDNSGLLVGNPCREISKIGVVLDITADAVRYAAANGIELIVSHHPVIFRPVKTFLEGDVSYLLAKNGISAICAHTSLDRANGGVNDVLAETLGFRNPVPLAAEGESAMIRKVIIEETEANELAMLVADRLSTGVQVADCGNRIDTVALCGGAGGDFIHAVAESGCDAYITGEAKHHEFLAAHELGVTLIAAGHFETENPVVAALAEKIADAFDCEVEVIPQKSPVEYY